MKKLLALPLAASLAACASHTLDLNALSSPSDEIVWEASKKAVAKKDWLSARQYLKRIVDAFPESRHQADARIALADTYFDEGGTANYVLAESSYHEFLTLYPQHSRSDYAQYRAAECYFQQRNSPDRDQTTTEQALEEYQKLLDAYPQSTYVESTRARVHQCRQTLARSNYMVGSFYQRARQAWRSAISRYEIVLDEFPDYDHTDEVLYRIAQCMAAAGRYAEALPHLGRLETEFPNSPFLADAKRLRSTFPARSTPAEPSRSAPSAPATRPNQPSESSGSRS